MSRIDNEGRAAVDAQDAVNRGGNLRLRPRRSLPERLFPPYSYVSGKFPHPTRDPHGHSYGAEEAKVSISRPDAWRECKAYLWGIDLFNNGYYWEAHETWEAVWHAAGRKGTMAEFCKALIKLAAAGVKAREGRVEGVARHAQRAGELLESVATKNDGQQQFMGLCLPRLIQGAEALIDEPRSIINTSDETVVVVMPFFLQVMEKN